MFKVENNILYLVKNDTARFHFELSNHTIKPDDTLTFTVKKDFGIFAYISKTVNANEDFILLPEDTAGMYPGTYWYDVQLNTADGGHYTVVPVSRLELVEEVTATGDILIGRTDLNKYVISVNNKYGVVTLTASDLGAVEANDLANVAFSGDYEDLTNKPTIPEPYVLPAATTTSLGGVKPDGTSIVIQDGVISSVGGGSSVGEVLNEDLKAATSQFGMLYGGKITGVVEGKDCSSIEEVLSALDKGLVVRTSSTMTSITITDDQWKQNYERFYLVNADGTGKVNNYGNIIFNYSTMIMPIGTTLLVGTRDSIANFLRNNIAYDNSISHLQANTIRAAIDELALTNSGITTEELENILAEKNYATNTNISELLNKKQDTLVSGVNLKTINGNSLLGNGNLIISGGTGGNANWGNIGGNISDQTDLQELINTKQAKLVSGQNIKTINGNDIMGEGDLVISGSGGADWGNIGGTLSNQTDLVNILEQKVNSTQLATVATTGDYNDLINTPDIPSAYVLPPATTTTLGGIKVGEGLSISNGVLNANAQQYQAGPGIKIEGSVISLDVSSADEEAF